MDYVLDFARSLTGGGPSRGRRRGHAGFAAQLRIAILGIMLGLALPSLRGTDWRSLLPDGVTVELPQAGRLSWPAGEIGLPPFSLSTWLGPTNAPPLPQETGERTVGAHFGRCGRGVAGDCVVDGDTFRLTGEKVRVADIDTPETHPSRCAREARLGERATERMRALLNEGPMTLKPYKRGHDRYGRRLAVVMRGGESLGERLVAEGLARRYDGGQRRGWCGWA